MSEDFSLFAVATSWVSICRDNGTLSGIHCKEFPFPNFLLFPCQEWWWGNLLSRREAIAPSWPLESPSPTHWWKRVFGINFSPSALESSNVRKLVAGTGVGGGFPWKTWMYRKERKVQYPEILFLPVLCHEQKQDILRNMEGKATVSILFTVATRETAWVQ